MQKRKIIVFSPTEGYELRQIANSTVSETGDRDLYKSFLPNPLMIMIIYFLFFFYFIFWFFFLIFLFASYQQWSCFIKRALANPKTGKNKDTRKYTHTCACWRKRKNRVAFLERIDRVASPNMLCVCVCTRGSFRQLIEYRFNKFYGPVATIGWSVLAFLAVDQ